MTHQLNLWSTPEVAKTWPEGSQVVWRVPLDNPTHNKMYRYAENSYHRPHWIGKHYPVNQPGQEFMLLELPVTSAD